jgi:WD40 repeat protein
MVVGRPAYTAWHGRKGCQDWALQEGDCTLPRGSWDISCGGAFPQSFRHAPLQARRLDPQLATTIMSGVTPQLSNNEPQPHLVISANDTDIWWLEYLPDGRRVVSGSGDRNVKIWNLENGEQEGTSMKHESEICGLAVTRDGTRIISSDEDGKIKVWNVESHEIVKEWTHPENWPRINKIAFSPDDRLIAVACRTVAFYTIEGRRVNHSIKVGKLVWCMCFSPDGKKLACGTYDDIRVYDVDSGTLILGPLRGHQESVFDVLWSRDGSRLFSASVDKTIRCWNSDTGEQIGHPWTGHTTWIRSLSLSPDGSILASACWDNTVRFWDTTTGNPIGQLLQHDEGVRAVRFSPSGESVASAGWDHWDASGRIFFWRLPWLNSITHQVITPFRCTSVFILIPPSI